MVIQHEQVQVKGGEPADNGERQRGRRAMPVTGTWKNKKGRTWREAGGEKAACVPGLGAGAMLDAIMARHPNAGGDRDEDQADQIPGKGP